MSYLWDWSVFNQLGPDGTGSYLYQLYGGARWTIATAFIAAVIAVALGVLIGVMRTLPSIVSRAFAASYVEVFRDIPLLVQMFVWFFVVPELLPAEVGDWIKSWEWGPFITVVISLAFYSSARIAELVRATINSLPTGQLGAGLALGLRRRQVYKLVILPQAMRLGMPPLTSEMIGIVKNTSVGMTIGLMELTARAREMQEMSFHTFEAFAAATIGYLIINVMVILLMRGVEKRLDKSSTVQLAIQFKKVVMP